MSHNWFSEGWVEKMEGGSIVEDDSTNITGSEPGFVSLDAQDFNLRKESACVDTGIEVDVPPLFEYVKQQQSLVRTSDKNIDIGAYEYKM